MAFRACIVCGRRVPKRVETKSFDHSDADAPTNKADCAKLTNHRIVSIRYWRTGQVMAFSAWDGESYMNGGYFCTNACAQDQGMASARSGQRFQWKPR